MISAMTHEAQPYGKSPTRPALRPRCRENLLLRRVVLRLCALAAGRDEQIDAQLVQLGESMNRPGDNEALEHLLIGLSEVAGPLDEAPPIEAAMDCADGPGTETTCWFARQTVLQLLDKLVLSPRLQSSLNALSAGLSGCNSESEVVHAAEQLALLINQQAVELQNEQAALAETLKNVSAGLDRTAHHLVDEALLQETALKDSAEFNRHLQGEVDAIDSGVRKAANLSEAQGQVLARIRMINIVVDAFRQRQMTRLEETKERTKSMKLRVEELERETEALQESVRAEQRKASTDALTGIPNRLAFQQRMTREFLHWKASGVELGIAIWDVDHFKAVNDRYGHAAGDKALRVIARHLMRNCRSEDFFARVGGEEFVMIVRGLGVEQLMEAAERVRISLGRLGLHCEGSAVPLSVSCGLSLCHPGDTEETLLKRADAALYQAKRAGRNRCFLG